MADKTETTVNETGVNSQENVRSSIFDDPDTKSLNFHRSESVDFILSKNGVGTMTLFRKYDFMLKVTGDDEIVADKVESDIIQAIDHVLGVTKAQDVEKYNNFREIDMNGKPTLVYTVFIPFSERMNLIVQNIMRQVQILNAKVESEGYQFIVRRKDMVKVTLDTNIGISDKVFLKGVLAASHENAIVDRETGEIIRNAHDNVRGNVYIDASIGLTRKEAFMFNRYNLSLLKFGVYGDDEDEEQHKVVTLYLPFKKKFFIEEFQIEQNDLGDGRKFKCTRTLVPVILKMSKIVKMSEFYTPTGIIVTQKKSVIGFDTFKEIFLDENGKNVLISKAEMDESSFEVTTVDNEMSTIQNQIFGSIKNVEEIPTTETTENDSTKKSTISKKKKSVKSSENVLTEEDAEHPNTNEGVEECSTLDTGAATTEAVETNSEENSENQSPSSSEA